MDQNRLYYQDAYMRRGQAKVCSCEETKKGFAVTLDQTIFYPTGGGQPCDLGMIGEARVLDVSEKDEDVIHLCDRPLTVGEEYELQVDFARRFSLMQQHSGEHLVSGIVHRRFGYDNVGFHMGSDMITIDFSGELTMEQLQEVELEVNSIIWQDIPCTILYPQGEELAALPYRSKKELSGQVRLVKFGETDLCACCGLHVSTTGQIGLVKLFSTTKFHAGSRVELLCGQRALEHLNILANQNRQVSNLLSAKPVATAAAVARMKEELADCQFKLAAARNQLFALKAAELADKGDVLLFEEGLGADEIRRLADTVLQSCGGRCAVFSGEGASYKYAIGRKGGDLRAFAKELNAALNGRGGGKPEFIQGSVNASREQIEAFFG